MTKTLKSRLQVIQSLQKQSWQQLLLLHSTKYWITYAVCLYYKSFMYLQRYPIRKFDSVSPQEHNMKPTSIPTLHCLFIQSAKRNLYQYQWYKWHLETNRKIYAFSRLQCLLCEHAIIKSYLEEACTTTGQNIIIIYGQHSKIALQHIIAIILQNTDRKRQFTSSTMYPRTLDLNKTIDTAQKWPMCRLSINQSIKLTIL